MGKKQRRRRASDHLEPLKQQFRSEALLAGHDMVFQERPDEEKMSEVLVAFVEPYQALADTYEGLQRLIALGAIAWNAALLPRAARRELLNETIATDLPDLDPEALRELRSFLAELIARKERFFPHNKRFIANFRVTQTRNNYRVAVASTFEEPEERRGRVSALLRGGEAGSPEPSRAAILTCLALLAIAVVALVFAVRWLVLVAMQFFNRAR